jgi:radical SAM superfamily enzyme YgiQ (UPF0313 family)
MDTVLKAHMSPPLALLTLAGLTPGRHTVEIVNENIEKIDFGAKTDMVGITVTLDAMPRAAGIAAAFRGRGVPVVAGGVHITCCPEACSGHFDAICIGPAERVWCKIIRDAEGGRLQKEYCDMDDFAGGEIASPAHGCTGRDKYLYANVALTSRGCPNRCAFCYNSCKNRLYARRPIPDVMSDIKAIGSRHVLFVDDNFIGDPDYTLELLGEMGGMGLAWSAAVTTKILGHPALLDLMAKTGCKSLFIGFESVSAESLEGVGKDNRVELYEALVGAIHDRGIMVNASMVFGLDGDASDIFDRTLEWLIKMRVGTLTSHILTPYPGTELHRRMDAAGRILERDLGKYNTANVVFAPTDMTADELYRGYRRMYRRFYSFASIASRFPRHRAQRAPYLLFNLLYRKFGGMTSLLARFVPMGALGRLAARVSYGA